MKRIVKWPLLLVVVLAALAPSQTRAQTCGGTERWQVKVGTDSGVGNVDLTIQIPMSVSDMLHLHQPQQPPQGDNDTRLPEETHIYVVTGHLVKFKLETGASGDQDYHMVISDDTLNFTDDHAGQPPGHSLVAEIPNPDCTAGRHGDPSVQSRFIDAIRASRQELESQFPSIDQSGTFNDGGGIPVRIVGIGFFDFPHHQVGRASNNIELHPVLDISFNPQPGSFSISLSPATLTAAQNATATSTVSMTASGGFGAPVALTVDGVPPDTTTTFSPTSISTPASGSSTLSIAVGASTPPGTYALTIKGSRGSITQSAGMALSVTAPASLPTTTVTAPADGTTVSGSVNLSASGSDLQGVVKMELYIDGDLKACNFGATSISYPWDTTTSGNGTHLIVSKAFNATGGAGTSKVTVTVSN